MKIILALLPFLALSSSLLAQEGAGENLISNGDFAGGMADWKIAQNAYCESNFSDQKVGEFNQVLALKPTVEVEPGRHHLIRLQQTLQKHVKKGTVLSGKAWMRSPESLKVRVRINPGTKTLWQEFTLTPEWKEYGFRGVCEQDYDEDQYDFMIDLAYGIGTIELAGVRLFAGATALKEK